MQIIDNQTIIKQPFIVGALTLNSPKIHSKFSEIPLKNQIKKNYKKLELDLNWL